MLLGLIGLTTIGALLALQSTSAHGGSPPAHAVLSAWDGTRTVRSVASITFTCAPATVKPGYQLARVASSSINCNSGPLVVGSLRRGASAAVARSEAEASGYQIPPDYVPQRASNNLGWIFRAPGSTGSANTVRVGEMDAQNPTGYVRYYNAEGQPLNIAGNPGANPDTHLPLRSGQPGIGDEPLGDELFDLGLVAPLSGII